MLWWICLLCAGDGEVGDADADVSILVVVDLPPLLHGTHLASTGLPVSILVVVDLPPLPAAEAAGQRRAAHVPILVVVDLPFLLPRDS